MKEEDRLIATIAEIDEQTSVVPRGAFVLEPTGHVTINRCFEGLCTIVIPLVQYKLYRRGQVHKFNEFSVKPLRHLFIPPSHSCRLSLQWMSGVV